MCVKNGQLSRFVKDVRKNDYRRDREDSRGKDRQYEHNRSHKDRRQEYEWRRGRRAEGTREYNPQRPNDQVTGEILTIGRGPAGGTSDSARRARCKRLSDPGYPGQYLKPGVTITFSSEDVLPDRNPEADAVVIKAIIANKVVHRIHVDQGSSAEIMYWHCFTQLGAEVQQRLQPFAPH